MTLLRYFIGLIAFSTILFACKKEMSSENGSGQVVVDAKWEFKEAGVLFQGDIDTAFISRQPSYSVLTIEGKSADDKNGVLLMQIGTDSLGVGTYYNSDIYFQYSENGTVLYQSEPGDPNFDNFSITIDAIDSMSISGIFSGLVKGSDSAAKNIEEGKFSAELLGGIPNPGPDTIPDDTIPEPEGDYLPLGNVWTYGNLDDPENDTLKISATGDTTVESGAVYTKFYNDATGATRYFRKDTAAGLYYEYIRPNADFPLEAPVELIVLQENETPNFSWESEEYTLIYTATGVETRIPVKLVSTITAYNASYNINGKVYNNVVEVVSNVYVKQADGSFADAGGYATTYFAKGIGIVAYAEQTTGVGYGIRHYDVIP